MLKKQHKSFVVGCEIQDSCNFLNLRKRYLFDLGHIEVINLSWHILVFLLFSAFLGSCSLAHRCFFYTLVHNVKCVNSEELIIFIDYQKK